MIRQTHQPHSRSKKPVDRSEIEAALKRLENLAPPADLEQSVMKRIPAKGPWPIWVRLIHRIQRPVTVTLRPVRWASVMASLLLLAALAPTFLRTVSPPVEHAPTADIVFTFSAPDAASVALIGTFNNWNPTAHAMARSNGGARWSARLKVPPGRYEYAFLVDGHHVVVDPEAPFRSHDGFGDYNGVFFAQSEPDASL